MAARVGRSEIRPGGRVRRAPASAVPRENTTSDAERVEVMDVDAVLDEALASLQRTTAIVEKLSADMRRRDRAFAAAQRRIDRKVAENQRLLDELVGEPSDA